MTITTVTPVPKWVNPFLLALRDQGVVGTACQLVGISRESVYKYRHANPEFSRLWDLALEDALDSLEHAMWQRAREGVTQLKFTADGAAIKDPRDPTKWYEERKFSDTLAMFLTKRYRPEFRDNPSITINILGKSLEEMSQARGLSTQDLIDGAYRVLEEQRLLKGT